MKVGVYAGSFDPISKGHQDIIERALKLVDKLVILVMNNPRKTYWFTLEERKIMAERIFEGRENVKVEVHDGLLVDFMLKNSYSTIIKGIRDGKDFSEEMTYSFVNKKLSKGQVDTIFIPTAEEYLYVSSTFVRELAFYNQDLNGYVDDKILNNIMDMAKKIK